MSVANNVVIGRTVSKSGTPVFARIRNPNSGSLLTQAALTSISYSVRDITGAETLGTGSLTVSAVVYDTLQQADGRWTQDSSSNLGTDGSYGYNFLWVVPATLTTYTADLDGANNPITRRLRVDVKFTPASGEAWVIPFEFPAVPVWV